MKFILSRRFWVAVAIVALLALILSTGVQPTTAQGGLVTYSGYLGYAYGDQPPGSTAPAQFVSYLTDLNNQSVALQLDPQVARTFVGRAVTVSGSLNADGSLAVQNLELAAQADLPLVPPPATTGSQPFVNLLCKFADRTGEPTTVAQSNTLLGNTFGNLDHYWRQMSENRVNLIGSATVNYVTMAGTRDSYMSGSNPNLTSMINACTAAADPFVNFSQFVGINMLFNDTFGCCAWGGSRTMTLDGVTKSFRTTWNPPWAHNSRVLAHEVGHSFGYPHSSSTYTGNSRYPYDSWWDVMSEAFKQPSFPQGTISFHLDLTGWIDANRIVTVAPGTQRTIILERLHLSPTSSTARMVKIPVTGTTRFYTLEVRMPITGDYETSTAITGTGVLIHEVNRSRIEDAQVQDGTDNSNANDDGAIWVPGETFTQENITVSVLRRDDTRFWVRVANNIPMTFPNDFVGIARNGVFYLRNSLTAGSPDLFIGYGLPTDKPIIGDWNGDGISTVGVVRDGTFYLRNSNSGGLPDITFLYGLPSDTPLAGDWDGNGTDTAGVFRNGVFYLTNSNASGVGAIGVALGVGTDKPLVGDWDGDGIDTVGIYRNGTFMLRNVNVGGFPDLYALFGEASDVPVVGDWDGDGIDTIGIYRDGVLILRDMHNTGAPDRYIQYGAAGDVPLFGRWAAAPDSAPDSAPIFVPKN